MTRLSAILLVTLAAWLEVYAQAEHHEVQFHGFGSWAYGRTDVNTFSHGTPEGNYQDSSFSLNLSARMSDNLRISAQMFFEEDQDDSHQEVDFAFAEWKMSDRLKVRAGSVKNPFGISTEVFDVGTLRPFFDLPQAIYGPIGLVGEAYKGIGLTGSRSFANSWQISYDGYVGGMALDEFSPPEAFLEGEPIVAGEEHEKIRNMIGGRVVLETPVDGLRFGFSSFSGTEVGSGHEVVYGSHVEYLTDRWSIRSEYAHETVVKDRTVDGAYFEIAYHFDPHWQAALQYDHLTTSLKGVDASIAPSLLDHKETAVGLNYWFSPSFVLKLSFHRVDGNRFAIPEPQDLSAVVSSGDLRTRTNLTLFGAQFSF